MRWSQILSAFFSLLSLQSLVSFALVTTQNWDILDKRGDGVKQSSKTYRHNSLYHPVTYDFHSNGQVTAQYIPGGRAQRVAANAPRLHSNADADHIFEGQMYHHHVEKVLGHKHEGLPTSLKDKVMKIINGHKNVAPIPSGTNRSKGRMVSEGLNGKALKNLPKPTRSYSMASLPAAHATANKLQSAFEQHGYGSGRPTFGDTLRNTYVAAGVMQAGSSSRYQQVGPNHYMYTPGANVQRAYIYPREV